MNLLEFAEASQGAAAPLALVGRVVLEVHEFLSLLPRWAHQVDTLLRPLARASIEGGAFIAIVWLLCRTFRSIPPALRTALWWVACAKLLVGIVWSSPLVLPVLPSSWPELSQFGSARQVLAPVVTPLMRPDGASGEVVVVLREACVAAALAVDGAGGAGIAGVDGAAGVGLDFDGIRAEWMNLRERLSIDGPLLLAVLWAFGILLQTAVGIRDLRRIRGIVRRAAFVDVPRVLAARDDLAWRLALHHKPDVRASSEIRAPQSFGLFHPTILLPARDLDRLSGEEIEMALGHEMIHLKRGDLWLGWIPALAERLFFFHPLARLAAREYAVAREASCDAAVVDSLAAAPQSYGRLLVRLGVVRRDSRLAVVGAASSPNILKRRLRMLHESHARTRPYIWAAFGLAALCVLVPWRLTSRVADAALIIEDDGPIQLEDDDVFRASPRIVIPGNGTTVIPYAEIDRLRQKLRNEVSPGVIREAKVRTSELRKAERALRRAERAAARSGGRAALAPRAYVMPPPVPGAVTTPSPAIAPTPGLFWSGPGVPLISVAAPNGHGRSVHVLRLESLAALQHLDALDLDEFELEDLDLDELAERYDFSDEDREELAELIADALADAKGSVRAYTDGDSDDDENYNEDNGDESVGWSFGFDSGDDDSYVYMRGDSSCTMRGSGSEFRRARRLLHKLQAEKHLDSILWFERDGDEYVIENPGTLSEIDALFGAQSELGADQGSLGAEQGELGVRQAELGAQQAVLGARQAALSAKLSRLQHEAVRGGTSRSERRALDAEMEKLEEEIEELSDQQEELGEQQGELGERQGELGERQSELGEQQARAARKAERALAGLIDQAIDNGTARKIE